MNKARRSLSTKYLSDISKGFLLAGAVGYIAGKVDLTALVAHIWMAAQLFGWAYFLTGNDDE
jgi:hypothetical protein